MAEYSFDHLVSDVKNVHDATSNRAKSAINQLLTIRNWAIGYYIVEFEQNGSNRAEYGTNLLNNLAKTLSIKGLERHSLNQCRIFYIKYPQIWSTVSTKLTNIAEIKGLPVFSIDKIPDKQTEANDEKRSTLSTKFETDPEQLITRLSFSHICEIMRIDDSFERFFYEFECMQGAWSVRELHRQITTNLYVRAGISKKPELLLDKIKNNDLSAALTIKEPYTFEFLGIDDRLAIDESDVETAMISHLQVFLMELGKGFCLEARQKRILIDGKYFYPDLVFYHRYLRCNVIFELKDHEFNHEDLGQLNAYVAYYRKNEMAEGDNPPVGVLLCTDKGPQMVEYALSGMDNNLFVSTYMMQLPNKEQLREFMLKQMEEANIE